MPIKIPEWIGQDDQSICIGDGKWVRIPDLIHQARDLESFEADLRSMDVGGDKFEDANSTMGFLTHVKAMFNADLDYPVIMDQDGWVVDGRHRIAKAIYAGLDTVKAVRFEKEIIHSFIRDEE